MQIAGSQCHVCKAAIVFAQDGKFCPSCGVVVHHNCDTESLCPRCKRPYQEYAPGDSPSNAVVPGALRSETNAAPLIAVVLAVLVALVLLYLWATNG